jgi:replication initiation and membrane attachment protein DnaB
MSAKTNELGNLSFSGAHTNFFSNSNNNFRRNNNNNLELNEGERGVSPMSLGTSPSIPIPERKFTAEEEIVIDKFVDFIRIKNVNDKPKLTKEEKKILQGMYWSRQFTDKVLRRLKYLGMRKESANLEKNYVNMVKSRKSRSRSRRCYRKTRKA